MKLNTFLWNNYKETKRGKEMIRTFRSTSIKRLITPYEQYLHEDLDEAIENIDDLINFASTPEFPDEMEEEDAELLFNRMMDKGIMLKDEDGEYPFIEGGDYDCFLDNVPILSVWLYSIYPDFYKPYFWFTRMRELIQVADAFEIELPPVPLRRPVRERVKYYWRLCEVFNKFQEENGLKPEEFCAFLYDFAPQYIDQNKTNTKELPQPTQVWMIGGNKGGGKEGWDLKFMNAAGKNDESFWQGNVNAKRGDIIVMYCLQPVSSIHSIWRATSDGIIDPFFHYYSNIYIGYPQRVKLIHIQELKQDSYFSQHTLIKMNFQGVNGWPLSAEDYEALLTLLAKKGQDTSKLPKLYSPKFSVNKSLQNEREVEIHLVEPLLEKLGFTSDDWLRQLPVRMGRGERSYPDYAFFPATTKGYEKAKMLLETKFTIKGSKDLEEAFRQAHSYALRLDSTTIILCDKDALWIYEKENGSFDRSRYFKKYWQELEHPDVFNSIKKQIGRSLFQNKEKAGKL